MADRPLKIAPSVLSADFSRLGDEVRIAEEGGADWIHVDVMDGHFVPNLTMGPAVTRAIRRVTELPVDVHLMVDNPDEHLAAFANAGADSLTVHVEVLPHLHRTLQRIHELGLKAGVALNPATPVESIAEIARDVDLVLVMTVNPGFGGQAFIPGSEAKVARMAELLRLRGRPDTELQVDGGIDSETVERVAAAGATVAVAGSAIYGSDEDVPTSIARLREAARRVERRGR